MQTQFALTLAESEFIVLLTATQHAKVLMYLLEEVDKKVTKVTSVATIHCRVFEDNSAALEIAQVPKIHPRTHHINVIYHYFCSEVANKIIIILPISTKIQQTDILTKPVDLKALRPKIMG